LCCYASWWLLDYDLLAADNVDAGRKRWHAVEGADELSGDIVDGVTRSPLPHFRLKDAVRQHRTVNGNGSHIGNRVVGVRGNTLVDYDIQEALKMQKPFEDDLYDLSKVISI
jgi:hypothetical protein